MRALDISYMHFITDEYDADITSKPVELKITILSRLQSASEIVKKVKK